jgi:hypothetical protein
VSVWDPHNIDLHALGVNSDLVASAMLTFAYSTETVEGLPGKPVPGGAFELPAPVGRVTVGFRAASGGSSVGP